MVRGARPRGTEWSESPVPQSQNGIQSGKGEPSLHNCQDSEAANLVLQRTMRKYLTKKGSNPLRIDIRWEHKPFVPAHGVLPLIDLPLSTLTRSKEGTGDSKKESLKLENQPRGSAEEIGKEGPQEAKKEGVKMNKEVANDVEEKKTNPVSSVSEKGSQTEENKDTPKEATAAQPQGK